MCSEDGAATDQWLLCSQGVEIKLVPSPCTLTWASTGAWLSAPSPLLPQTKAFICSDFTELISI